MNQTDKPYSNDKKLINLSKVSSICNGLMCSGEGPVEMRVMVGLIDILANHVDGEEDSREGGGFPKGERRAFKLSNDILKAMREGLS